VALPCKPLTIPHSDRVDGNECTGFTYDGCNFTCAKGYRRAQAQRTSSAPEGTGPLRCAPTRQEFIGSFAFVVSGAIDSGYNGVYTMTNRTCRGRAVWQQQARANATADGGPVLYAKQANEFVDEHPNTVWLLGPAARMEDCSDLSRLIYATNAQTVCSKFGRRTMQSFPDDVECNMPVTYWTENLPTSSCVGWPDSVCTCRDPDIGMPEGMCSIRWGTLRVERTAVGKDGGNGQQQLCVPDWPIQATLSAPTRAVVQRA